MAVKKTQTGNNKIYLFAGAILLGVAGYFGYKWYKKRKDTNSGSSDTTLTPPVETAITEVKTPTGTTTVIASSNPFKTKDEVLKFQQWVINTKKDKTILGGGGSTGFGDDGSWGKKSASAWDKYGKEYLTAKGTGATSTGTSVDKKDIDLIVKFGQGTKAEKTYLEKTDQDFVKTWAKYLRLKVQDGTQKEGVFVWSYQPYSTYNGERLFDKSPLGKEASIKKDGYSFAKPDRYSTSLKAFSSDSVGVVKALRYNLGQKILFAYCPDSRVSSQNKWIPVAHLTF